jgi:hypothetical protein
MDFFFIYQGVTSDLRAAGTDGVEIVAKVSSMFNKLVF